MLKSLIKFYWPDREYDWDELDHISAKQKGLWTWSTAGIMWLASQGLEVVNIEVFDYDRFINEGEKYLLDEFGDEAGGEMIRHSNIEAEQKLAREFVRQIETQRNIPTIGQIKKLLRNGFLVTVTVNARILNNKPGYAGHFVLVTGYDDKGFMVHDPGPPGRANRHVDLDQFEKAWGSPHEKAKDITAYRAHSS